MLRLQLAALPLIWAAQLGRKSIRMIWDQCLKSWLHFRLTLNFLELNFNVNNNDIYWLKITQNSLDANIICILSGRLNRWSNRSGWLYLRVKSIKMIKFEQKIAEIASQVFFEFSFALKWRQLSSAAFRTFTAMFEFESLLKSNNYDS